MPHLKALKTNKLAVAVGYEVRAKMWVYFGDVIDENRFHNCVGESEKALLVPVSKNELLRIMSVETELNNTVNNTHI